jgi:hypothetical protein
LGLYRIFALTYRPGFFQKHGFKVVDKSMLPHKIWADCVKCVKFPECDEVLNIELYQQDVEEGGISESITCEACGAVFELDSFTLN